jgi:hypothetical protein
MPPGPSLLACFGGCFLQGGGGAKTQVGGAVCDGAHSWSRDMEGPRACGTGGGEGRKTGQEAARSLPAAVAGSSSAPQ